MRMDKYPLSLVGNMDKIPAFFDMVPSKCIAKKGDKEFAVRSSRSEKKHLTVVLPATADEKMLPPMISFKEKTDQTIRNLIIPTNFVIKTQEKAWMDGDLMQVWLEKIWIKHTQAECKRLGFQRSMLTFDTFAVHLTDGVEKQLLKRTPTP